MSRVVGFVVGLLIGAFSVSAFAAANPWPGSFAGLTFQSAVTGGGVSVEGPFSVWPAVNDGSGGAKFQGSQRIVMPKASATVTLSRAVTAANLARFARLAVGASMPLAMLGLAYEGIVWVSDHWEKPGVGGGTSVSPAGCWKEYGQSVCYGSIDALCAYRDSLYGGSYNIIPASSGFTMDGGSKRWDCQNNGTGGSYGTGFLAPADECAVGEQYTGGQCVAVGTVPATDGEVESSLAAALAADPTKAAPLLANASDFVPVAEAVPGPLTVTGPATVNGGTSTSSKVDTSGTTTTNNTTTYNLAYSGGTVNITETVTSVVTFPDSSTSTTTTTTGGGDGTGNPPAEPVDICAENPDAAGCVPLGGAPEPVEMPSEDRPLTYSPEKTAAGGCPADQTFSVMGSSQTFSYGWICTAADGIRPLVLAIAWLGAIAWVFAIARGSKQ